MNLQQQIVCYCGLLCVLGSSACARGRQDDAAARIAELEVEMTSLEGQLTAAQESARACEAQGNDDGKATDGPIVALASADAADGVRSSAPGEASGPRAGDQGAPDDLPVLRLTPEDAPEAGPSDLEGSARAQHETRLAQSNTSTDDQRRPAEIAPDATRPVLKVRGAHEAWVYHRPVSSDEAPAKSKP